MASRPLLKPFSVFNTTTGTSMAASLTSLVSILDNMSMVSYSIVWSGGSTPIGTISVQVSNDYAQDASGTVTNAGTWNTLPFTSNGSIVTSFAVSGNSGNGFIDITGTAAHAIRLVYTRTSGSGTLAAVVVGKVA